MVECAAERYGRVDGIANCVGSMLIKPAHLTSDDEFMYQLQTNTVTSFNVVKASVRCKPFPTAHMPQEWAAYSGFTRKLGKPDAC